MKFMGFQFDGLEKSQFTDPPAAHAMWAGLMPLCVGARVAAAATPCRMVHAPRGVGVALAPDGWGRVR